MKKFRLLRADEIDCRVSQVKEKRFTCTLLLYKDARCDMNILDETVGPFNWQREHILIDGQLFCRVGIREEFENYSTGFVWKEDVGTESYTEAEKGRASDSFKRACFNWGIGRELYTAPEIEVKCNIVEWKGKKTTFDKFVVDEIGYDRHEQISHIVITKDGTKVFEWDRQEEYDARNAAPTDVHIRALRGLMAQKGVTEEQICERYKVPSIEDLTMEQYTYAVNALDKTKEKA